MDQLLFIHIEHVYSNFYCYYTIKVQFINYKNIVCHQQESEHYFSIKTARQNQQKFNNWFAQTSLISPLVEYMNYNQERKNNLRVDPVMGKGRF